MLQLARNIAVEEHLNVGRTTFLALALTGLVAKASSPTIPRWVPGVATYKALHDHTYYRAFIEFLWYLS